MRSAISSMNRGNVVVVEIDLRRPDRGQPVVGPAEVVARHDVVHLAAAVEHHLQQRLQLVDAADAGQRGVLADGVPARDRTFDERTLLAHLGDLGGGHRRHRDLGELRQVQHALGVLVVHAAGDQAGRVVAHHVQYREAQRVAGELVGGVPHLAGRLGPGRGPPCPCPCAGCPGRGTRRRSSARPSCAVADITRSLPTRAATSTISAPRSIPTRSTRKSISSPGRTMPRNREVQPTTRAGGAGLAVGGGDHVLRGGREPHAVHDGRFQPGEQRGGPVGVDRVVVTGDHREGAHVGRRGDGDVAAAATRRIGRVIGDRPAGTRRVASSAAPVRPRIANRSSSVASTVPLASATSTVTGTTRPYSVSFAAEAVAVTVNSSGRRRHRREQMRGVVQVHQAQQAFDHREAVVGERGSRWPRKPRASSGRRAHRAPGSDPAPAVRRTSP